MNGKQGIGNGFVILSGLVLLTVTSGAAGEKEPVFFQWKEPWILPAVSRQSESLGVAGAFAGVSNDALIVAGGANFPKPYWESDKVWHDDILVLEKEGDDYRWQGGFKLDRPLAYGMSVTSSEGVVCIGGADARHCYAEVFLLRWVREKKTIIKEDLPALPQPCAYGGAARIGERIFVAGGQDRPGLDSAMKNFWSLDLSQRGKGSDFVWKRLAAWPGSARAFHIVVAQDNGQTECVYVISGRCQAEDKVVFLTDVYEYNPLSRSWRCRGEVPRAVCAGTGAVVGERHIVVFGGDDGMLFHQADELKDNHPGFAKAILAYDTINNTWSRAGEMPQTQVTAPAVGWNDEYLIVSGEIRPRVRSPQILRGVYSAEAVGLSGFGGDYGKNRVNP